MALSWKVTLLLVVVAFTALLDARPHPDDEAPEEEAPANDAPAEDAPAEEAPVEEAPAEDAPAEDMPIKAAPAEEAPAVSAGGGLSVTIRPCAHQECPAEVKEKGAVCGADGLTYFTDCDRECWGKGTEKAHDGPCKVEEPEHQPIVCLFGKCPEDIEKSQSGKEECGEDGVTYINACDRYCYGNEVPKKKDGPCEEE